MTAQPLQQPAQPQTPSPFDPLPPEKIKRIVDKLNEWMADESGYDEESWPEIQQALDQYRDEIGARRLFDE